MPNMKQWIQLEKNQYDKIFGIMARCANRTSDFECTDNRIICLAITAYGQFV